MKRYERGFTIIEVLLFLGISALLLTAAIATVGASINSNRFNDAVRGITLYLQGQYTEVAAGKSDRSDILGCSGAGSITTVGAKAPGMTNCVILGRLIKLEGSSFTTRYILGYKNNLSGLSADDTEAINQMSPWVADTATFANAYAVPWGIGVDSSKIPASPVPTSALGFAIIRSPASGAVLYYAFPVTGPEPTLNSAVINKNYLNKQVDVCIADEGSGRQGYVRIAPGQGQEVIQTDLESNGSDC